MKNYLKSKPHNKKRKTEIKQNVYFQNVSVRDLHNI